MLNSLIFLQKSHNTSMIKQRNYLIFVRICLKFLFIINSFFVNNTLYDNSYLLYYCNIRFPYKIRTVFKIISINILGYERKKL